MRVTLRDVTASDIPIFYEHQLDALAARTAAVTSTTERETHAERWQRILADERVVKRAVIADDEVAGHIVCFDRDGLREVGYWLGRAFWGKGVGSAAVAQLLAIVPDRPLHARVAVDNVGSVRILERNGFVVETQETMFFEGRGEDIVELLMRLD